MKKNYADELELRAINAKYNQEISRDIFPGGLLDPNLDTLNKYERRIFMLNELKKTVYDTSDE